jgi:hypothetical protein
VKSKERISLLAKEYPVLRGTRPFAVAQGDTKIGSPAPPAQFDLTKPVVACKIHSALAFF